MAFHLTDEGKTKLSPNRKTPAMIRISPLLVAASFLFGCATGAQITNYEVKGNLAATNPLSCVPVSAVQPSHSAADISAGGIACAEAGDYEQAATLITVAHAYAFFDTQRVADESAHIALTTLFIRDSSTLPETQRTHIFESIKNLQSDIPRKREVCSALEESGPPSYMPRYMIAHGMAAVRAELGISDEADESTEPLVADFDPAAGWAEALKYIGCEF